MLQGDAAVIYEARVSLINQYFQRHVHIRSRPLQVVRSYMAARVSRTLRPVKYRLNTTAADEPRTLSEVLSVAHVGLHAYEKRRSLPGFKFCELFTNLGNFFPRRRPIRVTRVAVEYESSGLQGVFEFFLTRT